jgi:hypothetical protein
MSVEDMRLFCSSNIVPKNFFELDFPINTWSNQVNDTNPISLYELYIASKGKKGLNFSDLYRFNLRLDWDSPIRLPGLPRQECNLIFNNLQAVHNFKKEYVLLMYGNNTNKQIPAPYLNHLCREYEKLGIEVVANANGATFKSKIDNVSNIKFLDLTVPETVSLAMNSQAVIGGSNGCMALLESLELFKKFHVFLPNFALEDPEKLLFRKVSPFEGSNASLWPEMISLSNNLFEYSVEENPSEAQIKEVVNAIINR